MGDARVAKVAARELEAQGFGAQHCSSQMLACIDDDACRPTLIDACDVDALVGVEVRTESDGTWRRTIVIDGDGAIALSLDQPADGNVLVPAIAVETLRAMRPRAQDMATSSAPVDDGVRLGDTSGHSPMFWTGVVLSGVGVVVGGAAATAAGIAEAERADPTAPAAARVDAAGMARALWITAAAGALAGVAGAATACMNSDSPLIAPKDRRWCIE